MSGVITETKGTGDGVVLRRYEESRDLDACVRIWLEVDWIEADQAFVVSGHAASERGWVAELDGAAECMVLTAPGTVRYLREDLPLSIVTGVVTSRVGRRRGLAGRLTAKAVAADAAEGELVSALGIFDQGFYDKLGFGTLPYDNIVSFDPATLRLEGHPPPRTPRRFGPDDFEAVHQCLLDRHRGHGACNLHPAGWTGTILKKKADKTFVLGYVDDDGTPTHLIWCFTRRGGNVGEGPCLVYMMAWRTPAQLMELLGLVQGLGDQMKLISIREPAGMQFQDLLSRPFRAQEASAGSKYESNMRSVAYMQMRMNDIAGCLAATHLTTGSLRFNLDLTDPIERFLEPAAPWRGVAGHSVVTLGPSSGVEHGRDETLPTLRATVNAFTRLWLGCTPATGLAVTAALSGPPELLADLDDLLRLPTPKADWDF